MYLAHARRVMVVDHNEDTSFVITTLLSQAGIEVCVAKTASEA
jgi:CheY-like chemotaxis protein